MNLKRIEAENVLKYRKLRITDLPAQGLIGISGPNEAGKTAIGEAICLGLFGRTFSLGSDEISSVIRWGEYKGTVTVVFTGRDEKDYIVSRIIDNNGGHIARLFNAEKKVLADGPEAVDRAIHQVGGFTYQSFVDSFYLAQREMEVPHAKSATVKGLIGVDRLEAVAAEFQHESMEADKATRNLHAHITRQKQEILKVNLDRAHLGRLESLRDTKVQALQTAEKEHVSLATRADAIAKATNAFIEASRLYVKTTLRTNYAQWRDRNRCMETSMVAAAKASVAGGHEGENKGLNHARTVIQSFEAGLVEYDKVRNLAHIYRQRLAHLLDEDKEKPDAKNIDKLITHVKETSFTGRRVVAEKQIEKTSSRRRMILIASVVIIEIAMLSWFGWGVMRSSPDSTIGHWLQTIITLSDAGRLFLILTIAIVGTVFSALGFGLFVGITRDLKRYRSELEDIETEEQISRVEIGVIDAIDEATVPEALDALKCVRNDLVGQAIGAFSDGSGSVLVKPDALKEKLEQIRTGSMQATRLLESGHQRIAQKAAERKHQATQLRESITQLEGEVTKERERWDKVDALERDVAGLDTKVNDLRHQIRIREVGCELLDGACRRIYSRFHPELRRFVGKILPQLTEGRYEQLEVDDDLRVRVFCKDKNDFVGLAEISNGTHRQLMLCVRLALSQALIASSSKSSQFLFFDEPFAFFDEKRMVKAIDVLRKISPEITQVWLASQKFDPETPFDLTIPCEVNSDCLVVSGKRKKQG